MMVIPGFWRTAGPRPSATRTAAGAAAELFAEQLAVERVPSVRAIRVPLHVGQFWAQRLWDYLVTGAAGWRKARSDSNWFVV